MNINKLRNAIQKKNQKGGFVPYGATPAKPEFIDWSVTRNSDINKALNQMQRLQSKDKMVMIIIRGNEDTMDDLQAVGAKDLAQYFIPKGLKLYSTGNEIEVRIYENGTVDQKNSYHHRT